MKYFGKLFCHCNLPFLEMLTVLCHFFTFLACNFFILLLCRYAMAHWGIVAWECNTNGFIYDKVLVASENGEVSGKWPSFFKPQNLQFGDLIGVFIGFLVDIFTSREAAWSSDGLCFSSSPRDLLHPFFLFQRSTTDTTQTTLTGSKLVSKPVSKPVSNPDSKPVSKLVSKLVSKPVLNPDSKPFSKLASKLLSKPVIKPVSKSVWKPVSKCSFKPVLKDVPKPVSKLVKKKF